MTAAPDDPNARPAALARSLLGMLAIGQLVLLLVLAANHWQFPLFLETMEGTVLEHVRRAVAFAPLYPAPTPDFVPLAYNPLFYIINIPMTGLTGLGLPAVRMTASLGLALSALLVFRIVCDQTGDRWCGLIAAGLFAAAYKVMDAYLDTAHSDSWLLASILFGSWLIGRARGRTSDLMGVAVLCAAFWFKQHGALFAIAGVVFLIGRDGLRRSLPALALAIALGPLLYVFAGPILFGSHFHYFTLDVPSSWSTFSPKAILRFAGFLLLAYPLLLVASTIWWLDDVVRLRRNITIWHAQWIAGLASSVMATLAPGSAGNVFAPVGTLLIICGTIAVARALPDLGQRGRGSQSLLAALAFLLAFVPLLYDPRPLLVSRDAPAAYRDLQDFIAGLDGPVYSPSLGRLPKGPRVQPAAAWVALDDMVRGRRARPQGRVDFEAALAPALAAERRYLLMNEPLVDNSVFEHLRPHYRLVRDLGDRFAALRGLPGTYPVRASWPRLLYERIDQRPR